MADCKRAYRAEMGAPIAKRLAAHGAAVIVNYSRDEVWAGGGTMANDLAELPRATTGRLTVVTGAASGIGRSIAAHFLKEGLRVEASPSGRRQPWTPTVGRPFL
jgi:NAD(P)-dependent dehydrogenase (short-subunit alcohol dehydrogenase family)